MQYGNDRKYLFSTSLAPTTPFCQSNFAVADAESDTGQKLQVHTRQEQLLPGKKESRLETLLYHGRQISPRLSPVAPHSSARYFGLSPYPKVIRGDRDLREQFLAKFR